MYWWPNRWRLPSSMTGGVPEWSLFKPATSWSRSESAALTTALQKLTPKVKVGNAVFVLLHDKRKTPGPPFLPLKKYWYDHLTRSASGERLCAAARFPAAKRARFAPFHTLTQFMQVIYWVQETFVCLLMFPSFQEVIIGRELPVESSKLMCSVKVKLGQRRRVHTQKTKEITIESEFTWKRVVESK